MKKFIAIMLLVFAATSITLINCTKDNKQPLPKTETVKQEKALPAPVQMKVQEVRSVFKVDLIKIEKDYLAFTNAKKKPSLTESTLITISFDLVQTVTNLGTGQDSIHTTLPPDPTAGGVQSAVAATSTGGLDSTTMRSECNWYVSTWDGVVITGKNCKASSARPKAYRSYSTTITFDLHFSPTAEYQ